MFSGAVAVGTVDLDNLLLNFMCVACELFIQRGKQHCWNAEAFIGGPLWLFLFFV